MKAATKGIVEYVRIHPDTTSEQALDNYFNEILWSVENDEFERMTSEERRHFVEAIVRVVNRTINGLFMRW